MHTTKGKTRSAIHTHGLVCMCAMKEILLRQKPTPDSRLGIVRCMQWERRQAAAVDRVGVCVAVAAMKSKSKNALVAAIQLCRIQWTIYIRSSIYMYTHIHIHKYKYIYEYIRARQAKEQ